MYIKKNTIVLKHAKDLVFVYTCSMIAFSLRLLQNQHTSKIYRCLALVILCTTYNFLCSHRAISIPKVLIKLACWPSSDKDLSWCFNHFSFLLRPKLYLSIFPILIEIFKFSKLSQFSIVSNIINPRYKPLAFSCGFIPLILIHLSSPLNVCLTLVH